MWYTTRHEGFDNGCHSNRSPKYFKSLMDIDSSARTVLRGAYGLQLCCHVAFFILALMNGFVFSFTLNGAPQETLENRNFHIALIVIQFLNLTAILSTLGYQAFLADDAGWPRGYVAGSKFLSLACIVDLVAQSLQLAAYAFLLTNYDATWWRESMLAGGPEWVVFTGSRIIHGCALAIYAKAFPLLEVFHDVGTSDTHAMLLFCILHLGALSEIFYDLAIPAEVSFMLVFAGVFFTSIWALGFEPQTANVASLNETELVNTIQDEVEQYDNLTPYVSA